MGVFIFDQVEDSRYVFEAKTIKRMEILVLSTLQWKMNPVTPLSFLDYFTRRLVLKGHLCWEFLWRCERILLSVLTGKPSKSFPLVDYLDSWSITIGRTKKIDLKFFDFFCCSFFPFEFIIADSRFMSYLPSVVATATMLEIVRNVEPCLLVEYQKKLLGILGIDKVPIFFPQND